MSSVPYVLAVDPGTRNLGVALVSSDGSHAECNTFDPVAGARTLTGQRRVPTASETLHEAYLMVGRVLGMLVPDTPGVLCLVVEQQMKQRELGVQVAMLALAWSMRVRTLVVRPQELRAHFFPGEKRVSKEQLADLARSLYPRSHLADQHQCDAVLLARYALDKHPELLQQ
jgi:Holliday junction resolvasome RuvABC endonuclease subunit